MAGYTHFWNCETCGSREETMDTPRYRLCEKCDDKTRVRCSACGRATTVTPSVLRANRATRAVHGRCVVVDDA